MFCAREFNITMGFGRRRRRRRRHRRRLLRGDHHYEDDDDPVCRPALGFAVAGLIMLSSQLTESHFKKLTHSASRAELS